MKGNIIEALIGAVVLVVATLFLAFVYRNSGAGTVDGYHLVAKFERVNGLKVGSDVRISGIKVGTVTSAALDAKSFQAVVRFSVRGDVKLPNDTSAAIGSESLLGGTFLELKPGGSPDVFANGDEVEFTQGSVDLMGLISKAMFSADTAKKAE